MPEKETLKAEASGELVLVNGGVTYEDFKPLEAVLLANLINEHQTNAWEILEPLLEEKLKIHTT